jgi:hypothetical protein
MACPEMNLPKNTIQNVDLTRFEKLPKQPKKLLNDLFESAWKERELPPEQHHKPFLEAWSLLSYTAEITSGLRSDEEWFPVIRMDATWADRFSRVMDNPKSLMRMYTKRFAESWPIFDVAELMEKGVLHPQKTSREEAIAIYRSNDAGNFLPECWCRHMDEGSCPLPDWEHTLSAWFVVRRNLFKDPLWQNLENDPRIVSNAFLSLIYFFKESKLYFENPSLKPDIFDRTQVLSSL